MKQFAMVTQSDDISYERSEDPFRAALVYAESIEHVLEIFHQHLIDEIYRGDVDASDLPVLALSELLHRDDGSPYWTITDVVPDETWTTMEFGVTVELERCEHAPELVVLI